ncbi:MAG: FtsW/RodA/SpoVE family cell cycle protein [Clostridia bacterium]|nr:FtsW/RodA/SpoVE family cell cycle protein [Clostridia bacterium]
MLRRLERKLLLRVAAYLFIGTGVLFLEHPDSGRELFTAVVIITCIYFALNQFWNYVHFAGDPYMLSLIFVLCSTSLILLYRLNPIYAARQFLWFIVGLTALAVSSKINYRKLADYKYLYAAGGALLLLLPVFFGAERGGAKSWLQIGSITIQTSEFVKILLVLFLASYLSQKSTELVREKQSFKGFKLPSLEEWGPLLMMLGISLIFLVFQKDLGATLIFYGTFLAMLYISTAKLSYIIMGSLLFLIGGSATYFIFDHVKMRVETWINPLQYAETAGYQVIQSLLAFGYGGLTGAGLGEGFPHFIPAVHTDFIFAAAAEELGLAGALALLMVYILLIYLGFKIAARARDNFSKLLAAGFTSLMALQIFIIIGGTTKLLPLTGVTLPFLSYGGSSLVSNCIIVGLLMNISSTRI